MAGGGQGRARGLPGGIDAGVYATSGGMADESATFVAADGTVTDGPKPNFIGGITIVDVPSREEALQWASKIAAACRCIQEVRAIGPDPEMDAMLREAATYRLRHTRSD